MKKLLTLLFITYNPILIYLLMSQGGIGVMTIRVIFLITTLLFFLYVFVSLVILRRKYEVKLPNISFNFLLITIFLIFYIISILIGLVNNHYLNFILLDIFFFGELFLGYYMIKFVKLSNQMIHNNTKILGIYLFFMCIISLLIYYYLTFIESGTDFGAFKVYIDGIVFNRLVDFIIPIFAAPIIFYSYFCKNKLVHTIFILLVLLLCALTFYRTVYLAVFMGIVVFLIQNFSLKKVFYISVLCFVCIIFLTLYDSELIYSIIKRILTIFEQENSTSMSRSIRIEQLIMFKHSFDFFPFGYGVGGYIGDYVISTGNNIISLFLIFGAIAGSIFIYLILKILFDSFVMSKIETNQKTVYILTSCSSIIVSCMVILILFPYKYFPIYLLIGIMIGIIDEFSLKKKYINYKQKI